MEMLFWKTMIIKQQHHASHSNTIFKIENFPSMYL